MDIQPLLARDGLPAQARVLVGAAAAVWRADWSRLAAWTEGARSHAAPRAELEETLLMCVLFCGFPRAITAWGVVEEAWPVTQPPTGGALPAERQAAAGSALFTEIYGDNDAQVRAMLRGYHGELHDFVLEAAYGRILTRPALAAATRELVAVGVLAAQGQRRQFLGHARGAQHLGATHAQLREVLWTALDGDESLVDEWLAMVRP